MPINWLYTTGTNTEMCVSTRRGLRLSVKLTQDYKQELVMKDDVILDGLDNTDFTDATGGVITDTNFTQVASCAVGDGPAKSRRESLRAKLEREQRERDRSLQHSFITTFRNLFGIIRH